MPKPYKITVVRIFSSVILLASFQSSFSAILPPISGRNLTESEILPADVLARAELVREELELIRLEMGKPDIAKTDITILETAPREVYFSAHALFDKTNRLAFEHSKTSVDAPKKINTASIRPFHVWQVVNASYQRVQEVKKKLNIVEKVTETKQPDDKKPNDVIRSLLETNRLVSELLGKKVAPADVYQQVTSSVNITAQLLATFKGIARIPDEPEFIRRKTPTDVYQRLYHCFSLVKKIASTTNQSMLDFEVASITSTKAPSDVYDLATLVVSELSYFHALHAQSKPPAKAYYPGNKTPSHVFQRVGILERQLTLLLQLADKNRDWLN